MIRQKTPGALLKYIPQKIECIHRDHWIIIKNVVYSIDYSPSAKKKKKKNVHNILDSDLVILMNGCGLLGDILLEGCLLVLSSLSAL